MRRPPRAFPPRTTHGVPVASWSSSPTPTIPNSGRRGPWRAGSTKGRPAGSCAARAGTRAARILTPIRSSSLRCVSASSVTRRRSSAMPVSPSFTSLTAPLPTTSPCASCSYVRSGPSVQTRSSRPTPRRCSTATAASTTPTTVPRGWPPSTRCTPRPATRWRSRCSLDRVSMRTSSAGSTCSGQTTRRCTSISRPRSSARSKRCARTAVSYGTPTRSPIASATGRAGRARRSVLPPRSRFAS